MDIRLLKFASLGDICGCFFVGIVLGIGWRAGLWWITDGFYYYFFYYYFYYYLLHWLKREEKGKTVLLCPIDEFQFLKRRNLLAGIAAWKENWEKYRETCSSSWSASPVDHKSQIYYSVPIIVFKLYNMTCGQTNDIKFESFYKSHCRYITV